MFDDSGIKTGKNEKEKTKLTICYQITNRDDTQYMIRSTTPISVLVAPGEESTRI